MEGDEMKNSRPLKERRRILIIYNSLYEEKGGHFTIPSITESIQRYDKNISQDEVSKEINRFIQLGLVQKNFGDYSVCPR